MGGGGKSNIHSSKLTQLAGKWGTLNEDVNFLLKMGIFQPAMLGNTRGYNISTDCSRISFPTSIPHRWIHRSGISTQAISVEGGFSSVESKGGSREREKDFFKTEIKNGRFPNILVMEESGDHQLVGSLFLGGAGFLPSTVGDEIPKRAIFKKGEIPFIKHHVYLEPETSVYKWLFQLDDSESSYRKLLFHQTSI